MEFWQQFSTISLSLTPHAFDEAVWSTARQCGLSLSVWPIDTTICTKSGIRLGSLHSLTIPTGPTRDSQFLRNFKSSC